MPDNSIPAGFSLEASPSSADNLARFGPIADQAADAAGVPRELFRWQIQHESGWNPVAVNPQAVKGEHASGIAQFLPSTAKQFNADPFDPEQSLHASAQYMRQLYDQTGDWFHALKRYGTVSDHSPEAVKQDAARVITPAAVPPGFEPEPPVGAIPPGFTPEPREPDPMLGLAPNPRLQMETAVTPTEFFNRSQKFAERGIQNFGQLAHGLANAGNVQEEGALLGQAPDEQTREQGVSEAVHAGPLLPVSEFAPNPGFIHSSLQSAEGFTSPANLAIIGATMGAGSAAKALSGYALAAARSLQTALGVYFTDQMAQGTGAAVDRAIAAYKKHDLEGVKENLGFGSVQALMAAFGIYHAAAGAQGVLSTEVPKLPATPSNRWSVGHSGGFEPGKTPEIAKDLPVSGPPAAPEPGPGPTIDVQAEPAVPAQSPPLPTQSPVGPQAAPPADVPPGVPPQIPHFPHVEPHVESTLPTGFELESQPETPKTGDKSDKTPDWFKPGLPSEGEPIRKEGDQTTVSVVRWQRTPGTPEVNPQGATFFSIANQAGQSSDSTYAGATPAAIHWGGEHQVAGDISFSNPLELPTEKQGKYNLPLPEQIIRKLAGPAAADFDRHYSMETQFQKFGVARGRGFLDQEAELEARLGIPPGTIADARQGPPGQIANSVAIALLRRDGYDGAIGKPAAPTDLAEAVRLSPLAPQAQDDALPKAAHVAPAAEPTTTSSSPAEPPERKNELNELSPEAETPAPETLSYRAKGNHKADIRVWQDDAGKWHGESDYNLQGQMGGSGGFAEALDSRAEAIAESTKMSRRHLEQYIRHNPNTPAGRAAKQLLAWLTKQAGAGLPFAKKSGYNRERPETLLNDEALQRKISDPLLPRAKREAGEDAIRLAHEIEAAKEKGSPAAQVEAQRQILRDHLQNIEAAEKTPAKEVGVSTTVDSSRERPVAYGHAVEIAVPGEPKRYQARYALREAEDVQPSHNPQSFEPNPNFEHRNDRDYSRAINGARPVEYSSPGTFDTGYVVKESHTAEHGHTVTDNRLNALGGNARLLAQLRVYARGGPDAEKLKAETLRAGETYGGVNPEESAQFKHPLLTREVIGDLTRSQAQNAITDFNKTGAASLTPAEQSLSDSRRVSPDTLDYLSFQIAEQGEDGTLAQVLSSSKGPAIIERLIADGVITANQRGKYITDKGVTAEGKQRITQLMVGRLFDSPAEFDATAPELRNKLEKIVGPLARVEVNPEWSLTEQTREAVSILNDARQHGIKNLDDLERQDTIFDKDLSDDPLAIARLIHAGQVKAAAAFRQYAADFEVFQKAEEGHAFDFLTPPTPREAFESAFLKEPEAGEKPEPLASLTKGKTQIERLAAQGWYSQMVRTIEAKIPARVSPEQALAILKNPQHGVKADELKWTDLEDWLTKQSGPVTREEILDHANILTIDEKPATPKYQQYTLPGEKRNYTELLFKWTPPPAPSGPAATRWAKLFDKYELKFGGERRYGRTEPHRPAGFRWDEAGAYGAHDDPLAEDERAEYEDALTAADREANNRRRGDDDNGFQSGHFSDKNVLAHARYDERDDTDGKRVLFLEEIQSDWHQAGRQRGYKSAPAPLPYPGTWRDWASARGLDPNRNATVDENSPYGEAWREYSSLISAYHAAERDDYRKVPQAPFSKTWHEMVFRRLVRHAAEKGFDSVAWTTGKQQADRYNLAKHVAGVSWEPIHDPIVLKAAQEANGWGDLALTSKFGTAAENEPGHLYFRTLHDQKIGTPDELSYERLKPELMRAGELPDYIGKEAAKKLLSTELDKRGRHTLEGENLQVGGHGMNGFYDSILPAYAAKFGKKWGEKPQLLTLPAAKQSTYNSSYEGPEYTEARVHAALELSRHGGDVLKSPFTGVPIARRFSLAAYFDELRSLHGALLAGVPFHEAVDQIVTEEPGAFAELLGGRRRIGLKTTRVPTEQVHSLAITPAMRESVMQQGQPLFVRSVPLEPGQKHSIESVARNIDWRITPATPRRPAILRVNHQAALAISEAGGIEQFDGSTLADESLDGIASEMRQNARGWRIQGTLTPEGEAHIEALSKGLEEMQGQGWRAAVVTREDLPGAPFASIRKNARIESEELTHVQQVHYTAGYEPANHLTPSMRRFVLEHPAWKQGLWDALEKKRYGSNKSLHINILEAGAKLASGDPMGLTPEQAISYLKRYFQALRETHGLVPASEVFRFATRPIRTTLGVENAPREVPSAVRRTRSTRGQDRNYGHGEEVDTDTGDGANGPRATREPVRPLAEAGRSGDSGSLFGDAENQEVAETAARDRDQLQGQRLTAQFKAPLTREEQLKKLKRTKEDPAAGPQSDFFEAPPDKPQGSLFSKSKDDEGVTLGAGLGAMHPYLQRFLKGDVVPTLKGLAELARLYKGDLLKLLAPAAVEGAEPMALSVRHRAAELARATDVAHATLKAAGKYFDTRPDAENFDFIDRVETGAKQPTPELQAIHDILRPMLDGRRDAIRALGTGKLQKAIENYFPHLYKDPKTAQQVFENAGKRPLEGSKSFLKKRTIVTLKDAMAAPHNLEPFSANPVDFVLAKVREMDKYLAAHRIFADAKERGQLVAVDARDGQAPFGWKKIDDAMATIYGPSIQQISEYPNEGLHTGLDTVANALGLKQERGFLNLHGAIGRASRGGTVKTLHGTAEDVLAHEIGHQIDFRAGSGKRFVEQYPDAASAARLKQAYKTLKPGSGSTLADRQAARKELKDLAPQIQQRKAFAKELRDLADLRGGRKEYIRKREEKMAQLAQMWVGAREQFERTAPTVFKEWKQFLDQNPKLHALRDIEGNAKVQGLSQPYDVGGLVIKAHWWAPDAAARILNNYLSPGLRDKSAIVRSFLSVSNFMNQAQLGFSGFHAAFTLTEAATSHLALAIYQGVNGILDGDALSVAKSFKTAAFSPLAPFTSLMRGHQMLQEWNRPGSQSALIGQLADAAVIAGGRAKQESFYQTHIAERMMKAWREGNIFGATWRVPFAAFEIPTRIIMEGLVPRLKMGAFADMAEHELARLGPNAEPMDVERALAKVWDSVDNRFGQLVYDDLFWHKYTKDLAMMLVRSPGWNVGDIRELGGGYGDSAKFATLTMKKVAGKGGRPEFTHRMAYIPAHLIVALTLGGLLYYVWHKKAPERLVDWFFPTDPHGQRWSLPTYVKDEFHWATAPVDTAAAKLNPVVPLAKAIATGKDYFGRKIAHAHHYPAELKQWAEYVLTQYEPLWMQQNHHALHRQTTADKILPELGITHAPKALDKHSGGGSVHLHR